MSKKQKLYKSNFSFAFSHWFGGVYEMGVVAFCFEGKRLMLFLNGNDGDWNMI